MSKPGSVNRGGVEKETLQADSLLNVEPAVGLDLMTHEIMA